MGTGLIPTHLRGAMRCGTLSALSRCPWETQSCGTEGPLRADCSRTVTVISLFEHNPCPCGHDAPPSGYRAGVAAPDLRPRTRDLLWSDVEDVYAAILRHPFVTGLTDGSLPREAFRHYIVQDAHYLRGYARALALCGARAQEPRDTVMFGAHAGGAIAAEQGLHAALLADLGLTAEAAAAEPVAPTTRAYVSYLL